MAAGLARIRARRRILLAVLAALAPALALHLLAPWSRELRDAVLIGWVALYTVATLAVVFSRCPRCSHLFHQVQGLRNPLARHCAGCGLGLEGD